MDLLNEYIRAESGSLSSYANKTNSPNPRGAAAPATARR